jgi:HK97 family phage major capsid protein
LKPAIKPEPNYSSEAREAGRVWTPDGGRIVKGDSPTFTRYLAYGAAGLSLDERAMIMTPQERGLPVIESRTVKQLDHDLQGGFLVAPVEFSTDLLKQADDICHALNICTVHKVPNAHSFAMAYMATRADDATWGAETATGSESAGPTYEQWQWHPHYLAMRIMYSKTLAARAGERFVGHLRNEAAYKASVAIEKAWLSTTGGAGKPMSCFVAHANGIPSGRDVTTHNTSDAVKADNILECIFTLKAQYLKNARFLMHRVICKGIRKLKDGEGRYLFDEPKNPGEAGRIFGLPVLLDENAPSATTASSYQYILGDFSTYHFVVAMDFQVQILTERYAELNQNCMILRMELDGTPTLEGEGFVRSKLSS